MPKPDKATTLARALKKLAEIREVVEGLHTDDVDCSFDVDGLEDGLEEIERILNA